MEKHHMENTIRSDGKKTTNVQKLCVYQDKEY